MCTLNIGLAASNITPSLGVSMVGYYFDRKAEGIHDDLYAKGLWMDDGTHAAALVACDLCLLDRPTVAAARQRAAERLGLAPEQLLVCATHTHTGPALTEDYRAFVAERIADAVQMARREAAPTTCRIGFGHEGRISFNRRFWMKDGSVVTNPGANNPNVVKPVGPIDPRVAVLSFVRSGDALAGLLVNFALHLDTIGGNLISADYPFFMARLLRQVLGPELAVLFVNGAAGDINHFDVFGRGPRKGFEEPRRIGTFLAAEVMKVLQDQESLPATPVRFARKEIELPLAEVTPEEVARAEAIVSQPEDRQHDFVMDTVWAYRTVQIARAQGQPRPTEVQVLRLGDLGFVGIPGELFVELGQRIREQSPLPHTCIIELANDSVGYLPPRQAFEEGGYEVTSCRYTPEVGERIADTAVELLREVAA